MADIGRDTETGATCIAINMQLFYELILCISPKVVCILHMLVYIDLIVYMNMIVVFIKLVSLSRRYTYVTIYIYIYIEEVLWLSIHGLTSITKLLSWFSYTKSK